MAAGPGGARPGADAGEDRGTGPGGATTAAEARMTPGMDPTLARIDLHRHLDGSVRLETILDLGRNHGIELPAWDVAALTPYVRVDERDPTVMAFIERLGWMVCVLADPDACRRIAYENVEDAAHEGLDYLELRFSPCFMAEAHRLDPVAVSGAVLDGIEAGERDFGVRTNAIGIPSRTYRPEAGRRELGALLQFRERILALDLARDETGRGELFVQHLRPARVAG